MTRSIEGAAGAVENSERWERAGKFVKIAFLRLHKLFPHKIQAGRAVSSNERMWKGSTNLSATTLLLEE